MEALAPRLLTKAQAARKLGLGLRTVERLIASGELKVLRHGGRVWIPLAECKRYLASLASP